MDGTGVGGTIYGLPFFPCVGDAGMLEYTPACAVKASELWVNIYMASELKIGRTKVLLKYCTKCSLSLQSSAWAGLSGGGGRGKSDSL